MQRPAFFTSKRKKREKKRCQCGRQLHVGNPVFNFRCVSDVTERGNPCRLPSWTLSAAGGPCAWVWSWLQVKFCFIQQQGEAHESGDTMSLPFKKKKERKVQSKSPDLWGAYMRTKNIAKCRDQKSQAISWNPFENPGRGAVFIVGKETVPSCRG